MRRQALVLIAVLLVALSGCNKPQPPAVKTETIEMKDFEFSPRTLTIEKGTKVTWKNVGQTAHTVNSEDSGPLDSGAVAKGQSWSYTFNTAGTFAYVCKPHAPGMNGTITVA